MEKHTDRILELKSIYYSYHNADGELLPSQIFHFR